MRACDWCATKTVAALTVYITTSEVNYANRGISVELCADHVAAFEQSNGIRLPSEIKKEAK